MKTLFTLLFVTLLIGCVTRQPEPVPLTLGEQEQAYKSDVAKMSMPELCNEYRNQGFTTYRSRFKNIAGAEIEKRKYWSKLEWHLIQHHRIAVGVSEKLVRCSWGEPTSVNTRAASHEVISKLVYPKGHVHIHNNIVMAIQPSSGY